MLFNWSWYAPFFLFSRSITLYFTFTRCTFEESFIAKVSVQWGRSVSFFWSSSSWKSKSHSVRCSFCAEGRDQSWCQTAVRKRCCSAPMKNPWWDCSPGRNRRPARRTGSRAELFHYAALRAGRSLCTGPCEASRELSQMFLSEKDERKSQTNAGPTSGRVR